jgi:hypothetical protein
MTGLSPHLAEKKDVKPPMVACTPAGNRDAMVSRSPSNPTDAALPLLVLSRAVALPPAHSCTAQAVALPLLHNTGCCPAHSVLYRLKSCFSCTARTNDPASTLVCCSNRNSHVQPPTASDGSPAPCLSQCRYPGLCLISVLSTLRQAENEHAHPQIRKANCVFPCGLPRVNNAA